MKIVNRVDFLMLPSGTLFSFKFSECINDLCIKRDTIFNADGEPIDFMYESLIEDNRPSGTYFDSLEDVKSEWEYTSCVQRDGLFDDKAEYIIFDGIDVRLLVETINIKDKHENI